jgi:predicted GH43/DUF377 family glycosyl hydrolase
MFVIKRSHHNPLLIPTKENLWESVATFNWCPIQGTKSKKKTEKVTRCVYRATGTPELVVSGFNDLSTVGYAESKDGVHFDERRILVRPEYEWDRFGCEDPRVTFFEGNYYIFYTALSSFPFNASNIKVAVAVTKDFKKIEERHLVTPFNAKAMVLFPERINGKIVVMFTMNTDNPPAKIAFAYADEIKDLWDESFWEKWELTQSSQTIDPRRFDTDHVEVGAIPVKTSRGWLFVYSHIQHYFESKKIFGIEALLFDLKDPQKIIGRTKGPILVPEEIYEQYGFVPGVIFPSGAEIIDMKVAETKKVKVLRIYYGAADTTSAQADVPLNDLLDSMTDTHIEKYVKRSTDNPVLVADPNHAWEARAVFNPAAVELNKKIYILYRAMSDDNTSTVGLAISKDGLHIDERLADPIYVPRESFELKRIPGGNSGCEDPRIVAVDDRLYMTYTAYDGIRTPAIAITSISKKDFLARIWNWEKPYLISPPEIDDKDSCILSEKVNGKYLIFHRIGLNICADHVNTLNFETEKINKCIEVMRPRPGMWDGKKIGISAPPIKTKKGWLLLYHGISERSTYRLGAALLDLKDPTEVIGRVSDALLSPDMKYEKEGQVGNVVFPCGAVARKNTLFVYYGGADSVVGIATIKLDHLLKVLIGK